MFYIELLTSHYFHALISPHRRHIYLYNSVKQTLNVVQSTNYKVKHFDQEVGAGKKKKNIHI